MFATLGLLAFSFALGPDAGDAAYVEVGNLGVAIVNGTTDPGRRRFSLAHELGHHQIGDAYEPQPRIGTGDTERMIGAFAAYFLMPRSAVLNTWNEFSGLPRTAAIAVAVRFRVSWTAACNQLRNLNLIDAREHDRLLDTDLTKGEMFGFGERCIPELEPPAVPSQYARAVVNAYTTGRLTSTRAIELLHGTLLHSDLPPMEGLSLDQFHREFMSDGAGIAARALVTSLPSSTSSAVPRRMPAGAGGT